MIQYHYTEFKVACSQIGVTRYEQGEVVKIFMRFTAIMQNLTCLNAELCADVLKSVWIGLMQNKCYGYDEEIWGMYTP